MNAASQYWGDLPLSSHDKGKTDRLKIVQTWGAPSWCAQFYPCPASEWEVDLLEKSEVTNSRRFEMSVDIERGAKIAQLNDRFRGSCVDVNLTQESKDSNFMPTV